MACFLSDPIVRRSVGVRSSPLEIVAPLKQVCVFWAISSRRGSCDRYAYCPPLMAGREEASLFGVRPCQDFHALVRSWGQV